MLSLEEAEQVERYDAWQHTASIKALIAEIHRDPDKRKEIFTMQDFMPVTLPGEPEIQKPEPRQQTWQEMKKIAEILNAALGGEDTRERG